MRYLLIVFVGCLAACSSHNATPAASADSVAAATATPTTGPSFAPAGSAAAAAAPGDEPWPATKPASKGSARAGTVPSSTTPTATTNPGVDPNAIPPSTGNATALPVQSPPSASYEADNTRVNARDRSGNTLTPMDQGPSESDRGTTQQIRRLLVGDSSLSFTAKNVKIITINGKVTLRGAVKTDDERMKVAALARKVAGDAQVENFLEISK